MDRDVASTQFSMWDTLENIPIIAEGNKHPIITTTEEAINVIADKHTGVYRNKHTQQFVFVVWHYDMPFEIATLTREMWRALPLWAEETTRAMADEWGISDLFSLCGSSKKRWEIIRNAIRVAMNDHNLGSVMKRY